MTTFSKAQSVYDDEGIETGKTWPEKGLSRQAVINATGRSSSDDKGWLTLNYFPEAFDAYPAGTNPLLQAGPDRSGDPTLVDDYATYPVSVLEGQTARDTLGNSIDSQVPIVTVTDEARDPTARAKAEQMEAKRKAALSALSVTADVDLPTYDSTLPNYNSSEQDYAGNLAKQELRNLAADKELKDIGGVGRYTTTEATEMANRIKHNEGIQNGSITGTVDTPATGPAREDIALEGELVEKAVFQEISFDHNGTDYFMPEITLPSIPDDQDSGLVYGIIYNASNTYLGWVPFTQQADGTWKSATGVSRIPPAATPSRNWRVAVAVGHVSTEITNRVHLLAGGVTDSDVRFGGRG